MGIATDGNWIWYSHDGLHYHGFFLQADRGLIDPDLRHLSVTQGPAVPHDLGPTPMSGLAKTPTWDDSTIWTGLVVQGPAGLWHLFCTGTDRLKTQSTASATPPRLI